MKINEALSKIDALTHNTYRQDEKIEWLSKLDSMIKRLIIDTHVGYEDVQFSGYTVATPMDTELLVQAPFDAIYLRWMEAQIHYHNGEYENYNNAIVLYNTEYEAFSNDYNRKHMPLQSGRRFVF